MKDHQESQYLQMRRSRVSKSQGDCSNTRICGREGRVGWGKGLEERAGSCTGPCKAFSPCTGSSPCTSNAAGLLSNAAGICSHHAAGRACAHLAIINRQQPAVLQLLPLQPRRRHQVPHQVILLPHDGRACTISRAGLRAYGGRSGRAVAPLEEGWRKSSACGWGSRGVAGAAAGGGAAVPPAGRRSPSSRVSPSTSTSSARPPRWPRSNLQGAAEQLGGDGRGALVQQGRGGGWRRRSHVDAGRRHMLPEPPGGG